jgi:hypothetical protein
MLSVLAMFVSQGAVPNKRKSTVVKERHCPGNS